MVAAKYFRTSLEENNAAQFASVIMDDVTITRPDGQVFSGAEEAREVADSKEMARDGSGDISISFSRGGEEFVYEFKNSKDGLTLK